MSVIQTITALSDAMMTARMSKKLVDFLETSVNQSKPVVQLYPLLEGWGNCESNTISV